MESGIHADQNFYKRLMQDPSSDHGHQIQPQHQQQQQQQQQQLPLQQHTNYSPHRPEFEARSPQLPPKLPYLTTQNLETATSNGYSGGASAGDPDDFYKDYRGVQPGNTYGESTNGMAATVSELRQGPASLRSNGNGTTPKHPSLPVARNGVKTGYRSASSPLDNRIPLSNAKSTPALNGSAKTVQKVSVKDLSRKFDTNNAASSPAVRRPAPRIPTKDASTIYSRSQATTTTPSSAGSIRAGQITRETGMGAASRTQRARFATEDQHSNNTLSSAARTARPRTTTTPGNHRPASRSMSNLSPAAANPPPPPQSSPPTSRQPLFGEVLPTAQGPADIGYGIPQTITGRASESGLRTSASRSHNRSRSDFDAGISPSSPTAWYLGVTPELANVETSKPPRLVNGHNRAHSDSPDRKANPISGVNTHSFQRSLSPNPAKPGVQSRIPMVSKRLNTPSASPSPPTTRANSPYAIKAATSSKLRKPESRPWSPVGRSTTPTGRAVTPNNRTPRGKAKSPGRTAANNGSLQAHIVAPPLPKTSPPLRSSRPRQPVSTASTASTASSRQRTRDKSQVRDRSGSPNQSRTGMRITRTGRHESPAPKRMPEPIKVDFAARREKIQRAYTKSIHENEQALIRAANLERLTARGRAPKPSSEQPSEATIPISQPPLHPPPEVPVQPLSIKTTFSTPRWSDQPGNGTDVVAQDSPTLGIPGSFPGGGASYEDDDIPVSAISNMTGTTEIENEPQTAPARMSRMASTKRLEPSSLSQQMVQAQDSSPETPSQPEVQFQAEEGGNEIPIILDATPIEKAAEDPDPSQVDTYEEELVRTPSFPGAFEEEPDYELKEDQIVEPKSPYDPLAQGPSPPGAFQEDSPPLDDEPVFSTHAGPESPLGTSTFSGTATPLEPNEEHVLQESPAFDANAIVVKVDQHTHLEHDQIPAENEEPDPNRDEAPRLQLPMLRTALSVPGDLDFLHTPTTDMDYDSSEGVSGRASVTDSHEPSQQNRNFLHSPGMYQGNRQSAWTDYSVDTGDEYSDRESDRYAQQEMGEDSEQKPIPPPKEERPEVPPKPESYTPQPSPRFIKDTLSIVSSSDHQLPILSTGTGLGLGFSDPSPGYGSNVTSVVPLWPEHSPPPIPQQLSDSHSQPRSRSPHNAPPPTFKNKRPSSSVYRASVHGSRRTSDDAYSSRPSISTPRSSTHISMEDVSTANQSFDILQNYALSVETEEEKEAAEKTKQRLFQRKMVVKEFIDTEAVFLKDMNVVEEIYKGTAEACPKLQPGDINIIFRNTHEIVAFATSFLDELKAAGASVYSSRPLRSRRSRATTATSETPASESRFSTAATLSDETDDQRDRKTFIGLNFGKNLARMQVVYTDFLRNSEVASSRLAALQADPAVAVWLSECNLVAKDLTQAWDLDALLVKPVQRITRYKLLLHELKKHTPADHPDYMAIQTSMLELEKLLKNIDDLKKRIDMVGKIVGRKRKESDVRSGLAKAFGRRGDKPQPVNGQRPPEDEAYAKMHEKFQDDFLRLQVVLRDVEFYTRQAGIYVHDFLRYLSSMELVMRLSASPYPELESKWARFNMGMRDMGTVALEQHLTAIRIKVIVPFEQVIALYNSPQLAMKKRNKRRLDYEKSLSLKSSGKKVEGHLLEQVAQYEALNETLKVELPRLSALTEKIGNICLAQFVYIQKDWFGIWQDKVKVVLEESQMPKDIKDIVDMFSRDYKYVESKANELGIVNGSFLESSPKNRGSQSTRDDDSLKSKGRPSNLSSRPRGLSSNSDKSPSLPTPDFAKRLSGQFTFSPILSNAPGLPSFAPREQIYSNGHSRAGSGSPATPDSAFRPNMPNGGRPSTSRSHTSNDSTQRPSHDYNEPYRRQSGSTYNSGYHVDGPPQSSRPYSGLFHSAMPMDDRMEESARSSRASSRDRNTSGGYNVLYLAASLFEFNISATKSEAGYPYLTYQAGEIFDVIGEKGELWLAKNQDDPKDQVGWIWSKHFARLATD